MKPLRDILKPTRLTAVVDVGAAAIDSAPSYRSMLDQRLCTVVGFEPQRELWPSEDELATYWPRVIGTGRNATLKVCAAPGMTSIFTPDERAMGCFPGFVNWGETISKTETMTHRLDDQSVAKHIDFLKIDTQGSELAVIYGAKNKLKQAVAVQAEVHFIPIYHHQPMFRDIDAKLSGLGFVFHTFAEMSPRAILPHAGRPFNQIQAADAVYVRDFRDMAAMDGQQLRHLALISHYCFKSFDLAWRCNTELVARGEVTKEDAESYRHWTGE